MYYDKQGNKISLQEMGKLCEDRKYRIVLKTELPSGLLVSTVWLGIDHQWGKGKPLIFETMVFPRNGDQDDEICERYSTIEEALQGHERIVKEFGGQV